MKYKPCLPLVVFTTAALALAACNQQSTPQVTSGGTSASAPQNTQVAAPVTSTATGTPAPALGLRTVQEAAAQLKEADLAVPVVGQAPAWTAGLLDAQNHLKAGTLHAGAPISLVSPVELGVTAKSTAAEDVSALPALMANLRLFGNAALVPLLLEDGRVAGLARLPLYVGTKSTSASLEAASLEAASLEAAPLEYVLFAQPAANLMTSQEAATTAGQPEAAVIAVALGSDGMYDPFNFHWLVNAAGQQAAPFLVAPGLPALLTQRGELLTPSPPDVSRLTPAAAHLSAQNAATSYATYESAAQTTQRLNLLESAASDAARERK